MKLDTHTIWRGEYTGQKVDVVDENGTIVIEKEKSFETIEYVGNEKYAYKMFGQYEPRIGLALKNPCKDDYIINGVDTTELQSYVYTAEKIKDNKVIEYNVQITIYKQPEENPSIIFRKMKRVEEDK